MRPALLVGLLLLAPLALAAPAEHRAWAGPITHDLFYKPSAQATVYRALHGEPGCRGEGIGVVHVDLAAGTLLIANPDSACLPGYTTLSQGCRADPDGHVRCERIVGDVEIRADLAPDGALAFTYFDASSFHEWINGTLVRAA